MRVAQDTSREHHGGSRVVGFWADEGSRTVPWSDLGRAGAPRNERFAVSLARTRLRAVNGRLRDSLVSEEGIWSFAGSRSGPERLQWVSCQLRRDESPVSAFAGS